MIWKLLAIVAIAGGTGVALSHSVYAKQDEPTGIDRNAPPAQPGQDRGPTVGPRGQGDTRQFPGAMPGWPGGPMQNGGTPAMVVDAAHSAVYVCQGDVVYRLNATTLRQEAAVRLNPPRPQMMPPNEGQGTGR